MLRIKIKLPDGDPAVLQTAIASRLGVRADLFTVCPRKRSVDARQTPTFVWSADLCFHDAETEKRVLRRNKGDFLTVAPQEERYRFPKPRSLPQERPIVVGFGPAGMFCSLMLARSGFRPLVLERGGCLEERVPAVERFFRDGVLQKDCNIQFGEGGAGAFSDGKLNTLVKDRSFRGYYILEQLVAAGAPEEILWLNKPHIGTDLLRTVIRSLRQEILSLGGEIRFRQKVSGLLIENGRVRGVETESGERSVGGTVVLAIGHSARDTFRMLHASGVPMEKKPFSVGVRIEHPQEWLDQAQYGRARGSFPPADYKLVCHTPSDRTVYTFCMCPGGVVVAAASEEGGVVTNGMSFHARDGKNANSALLCEVLPEDIPGGLFSGMELQEALERRAFAAGGGQYKAPAQTVGDFLAGRASVAFSGVQPSYPRGVTPCDLQTVLPPFVSTALREALPVFGRRIKGFDRPDAVMTGVESRSTSPLRIPRDESYQSLAGLYPIGEGAGYAGGIISAAIDGLKCAEAIVTL